jgi:hypothetical protein
MKLHERVMPAQKAHNDISGAVLEAIGKHPNLTYLEVISILNQIQMSWLKHAIQQERHPNDPEKRGGEE